MALDPEAYGKYEQAIKLNLKGAYATWHDVPAVELRRITPIIRNAATSLKRFYNVALEVHDDEIYLTVEFKKAPAQGDVLILKGSMHAIQSATSWGGP